jgi:hypothetical protein
MDAWEEQIKSPNPSSAMLSKLNSLQNFSWPNTGATQMAAMNPMQFYMQFAQQWQKSWAETMAFWSKGIIAPVRRRSALGGRRAGDVDSIPVKPGPPLVPTPLRRRAWASRAQPNEYSKPLDCDPLHITVSHPCGIKLASKILA